MQRPMASHHFYLAKLIVRNCIATSNKKQHVVIRFGRWYSVARQHSPWWYSILIVAVKTCAYRSISNPLSKKCFKITMGIRRSRKSKKNRQHIDQKVKDKKTKKNNPQGINTENLGCATRTPQNKNKHGAAKLLCSGRVSSSCYTRCTRRDILIYNPVISPEEESIVTMTNGTYPWLHATHIL